MAAEPANGSTVSHQTSWVTVDEAAKALSIPTDELRSKLIAQNVYISHAERLPLSVVAHALHAEGYVPTFLQSVSGRLADRGR